MRETRWVTKLKARKAELLCGALLCAMAINLIGAVMRKTITNDETVLIPAGYYHVVAGRVHLGYEHPPLCKILAGIPLLFMQLEEVRPEELPAGENAWAIEMAFWNSNRDQFEQISFWSRLPMIALTLGLGVLVFAFGRELFGSRAAVLGVALFSIEPTVLAHGRVVQTDVPATFGFLLVLFTTYRYAGQPTTRRALWIGVAAGVALLAKFSMLVVGPTLLLFFTWRVWRAADRKVIFGHLLVLGLTTVLIVNAAYYFKHRGMHPPEIARLQDAFGDMSELVVAVTKGLSNVLPVEFVLGVLWQLEHSAEGHNAGLLGMYSKTGWWYYFPVAFALKTTLPFLLLSIVALAWASWRAGWKRDRRILWLLLPFVCYTTLLLFTGINIGVRYYLPAYGLLFILGGGLLANLIAPGRFRAARMIPAVSLVAWGAIIAGRVYPDYMPYMNAIASKHPHWWYLSDSNVEWGDDVKGLAEYLHARGEKRVRAALLGGFVTLELYGIDYLDALSDGPLPDTRYVALGASFLNGSTVHEYPQRTEEQRVNRFEAFRRRKPEAVIGGSIYVFRMAD